MTDKNNPDINNTDLGMAGRIARQFIDSPVTPLLMIAFLCIGLLGLKFTPRQEDPKISVPMVDVMVSYPGASAEQVGTLVTEPLERIMDEIAGVRHVYSATIRGRAIVTVRFKVGEDLNESIVKVHDKVQSNIDRIPPGVMPPLVKPVTIDDVPIVTATLWSEPKDGSEAVNDADLRTLALDVLQRLSQVPNTGNGFIVGGRRDQIRIEVSPERLSGHGITLDEVANTIRTANTELDTGAIESGDRAFTVYSGAFLTTAQDVANLVIGIHEGAPVYVRDVAAVTQSAEDTSQVVTFYSGPAAAQENIPQGTASPAVTIAIAKKIDTNGVTVAEAILEKLDSLQGSLIPDNVNVTITRNYGETADKKVDELLGALFEASIAVSLLCLVGLGLRAASVVITIIPIVILVTVFSAMVLDYTIDRVSLFALVFSIGILVDDATVVVENIFRRWLEAGKTTVELAIDAVREVGNPTILATLTIVAAMLPMGFVSGLMGPYMRPIPVLGSAAMFFSLIAAFVFAPWFAMRVAPKMKALEKAERREEKMREYIGRFYKPLMYRLCTNRLTGNVFLVGLVVLTLFACSMFYTNTATVKMLPFDNKPEFNVVINMPEGTALPVTANVASQLAEELQKIPEVTAIQTYAGTSSPFNFNGMVRHYFLRKQPWQGDIQVMLTDKEQRERGSHDIAVDARGRLWKFIRENNLAAKIQVVEMPPGPPVLQTVVAEIYGPDAETRRQVARDMVKIFEDVENIVDVDSFVADEYEFWRFEVDVEKAVRYGISVDDINRNLDMAMGEFRLGDVKTGAVLEPTWIVLQVPLAVRASLQRLGNLPIRARDGTPLPLAELGRFERHIEQPIIFHKDLRAVEFVTGEMEGRLGAPIYGMFGVEDRLESYVTPDGVTMTGMPLGLLGPPATDDVSGFEWGGEWTVTYETFRDMGLAFMAALVLIYGLIVWEFRNFTLAGLIMAPIPLTLIGIVPGHWILGAEFTATSMIGFIALAGIIVRNSILLVEFVNNEVASGTPIREAVINAGQTRMRPIFITALTLMAGAGAIIGDPIFKGMAASLLFGTAVATVLTLVVIPLGCITTRKQFYAMAGVAPAEEDANCELNLQTDEQLREALQRKRDREMALGMALLKGATAIEGFVALITKGLLAIWRKLRGDSGQPDPDHGGDTPGGNNGGSGGSSPGGSGSPSETGSDASGSGGSPVTPVADTGGKTANAATSRRNTAEENTPARKTTAAKKKPVAKKKVAKKTAKKATSRKASARKKPRSKGRRGIRLKEDLDE
jgi:multidrug efflux pump subunit AcrB